MSDPISMAKAAREGLARALAALQTDASVPPDLLAVAEPVSRAMGALFQIERSQGMALSTQGPLALEAVRHALAMLQAQPSSHIAVGTAMEAVAGSLGLVHGLSRAVPKTQPDPPVQPQIAPMPMAYAHTPQPVAPAYSPPIQAPPMAPAPIQPMVAVAPQAPIAHPSPPLAIPSGAVAVEVALAAHSPSNFYKGLAGNDVVQHGGIFVATYKALPIGQMVALRILFPGGYELDALGVVRFTRESGDSAGDMAHPGYGAQLTQISDEGRHLVDRYVRNREPMFYDDF